MFATNLKTNNIMKNTELICPNCGADHSKIYNIDKEPIKKEFSGNIHIGYSLQLGCSECDVDFQIIISEFSIVPF